MFTGIKILLDKLYGMPSVLLALTTSFWAGNAVAGQLAIGHISPILLVFLRWALVAAILWPIYGRQVRDHWPSIRPKIWTVILTAGMGYTGFNILFYIASHNTSAVNIGILQGSIPIFVLTGMFVAYGIRATAAQMFGVLVTAVGVVVVATRGAPLTLFGSGLNWGGDLLMLLACTLYASYAVALRNRPTIPGAPFFTLLALVAALLSLPFVALEAVTGGVVWPTPRGWMITAYVAIFPSALAQFFFLRSVDLIGPSRAGVYINLVPVFTAILAVAVIAERFAVFHGVALVLVLAGIWMAQRSVPKTPAEVKS